MFERGSCRWFRLAVMVEAIVGAALAAKGFRQFRLAVVSGVVVGAALAAKKVQVYHTRVVATDTHRARRVAPTGGFV